VTRYRLVAFGEPVRYPFDFAHEFNEGDELGDEWSEDDRCNQSKET
jgi:hypothetical protein